MTLRYLDSAAGITAAQLGDGFFDGWRAAPSPEAHLRVLQGSDHVVLAVDDASGRVVGFVTAVTDGLLSAYIPLLEVIASYQGQGIGTELMRRMLAALAGYYMVDLLCDPEPQSFYARLGMEPAAGMLVRRFDRIPTERGRAGAA